MGGPRASTAALLGGAKGLKGAADELRRPLRARGGRYGVGRLQVASDGEQDELEDEQEDEQVDEETKERLRFSVERRKQTIAMHFVEALRRKQRLKARRENLRFKELYRAPEPAAVVIVIGMITIVTLILTKSWPFY